MMLTLGQLAGLFTVPALAAAGAVAVAIPIVIHLLSRFRRKPQVWGAMRFVWEAVQRQKRRLQLEQWLLLAIRCLVVLVLGLALAGPILTGCAEQLHRAGLLRGTPAVVHVVLDDSLSTRAVDPTTRASRFEGQRSAALSVIDALAPSDRLRVWLASTPVVELTDPAGGAASLRDARRRVEALEPRFGASALDEALARVVEAVTADDQRSPAAVFVLSDWTRHDVRSAADRFGEALPEPHRLYVLPQAAGVSNQQVASVRPWRRVQVVEGGERSAVAVRVELRRFETFDAQPGRTLTVSLLDEVGRSVGSVDRSITWAAGQDAQAVAVDVPLEPAALGDAGQRRVLVLRAALEADAGDALSEDDARLATVELRRQLRVALVHDATAAMSVSDGGAIDPARWLAAALSPRGAEGGAIELTMVPPAEFAGDAESLRAWDAVVVSRPDLVNESAWRRVARYVESGGLAWVFPTPSDEPQMWPRTLRQAFSLPWQVAIEPQPVGDPQRGVAAASERRPPEALSLLSTDWDALLRPVRVTRWLAVRTDEQDAWVAMTEPAGASPGPADRSVPALLAHREHGEGSLLLSAVALDPLWTNLPTRPVFVPLIHESVRGVLGRRGGGVEALVGEPAVSPGVGGPGGGWPDSVSSLDPLPVSLAGDAEAPTSRVLLQWTDRTRPASLPAVESPGVWGDASASSPHKLVVNVDAAAGDTQPADEDQLAAWLDGWGRWVFVDPADPTAMLRAGQQFSPNIGWPLLWLLLGLVIAETILARLFSHARATHHRGITTVALDRIRRFHRATVRTDNPPPRKAA
jgi:hypothetical protein